MSENTDDAIRVLIVDDIAETRENIRKLLQFEPDINVVGAARSGEEALEIARETEPDVVIMDINMPDMDGIKATEAMLLDVPYAQIVILSVQSEADYIKRAMRAGARDFIAKPPSGDELITTIRSLAELAVKEKEKHTGQLVMPPEWRERELIRPEGNLLAVYSAKGGVGCTMLATNIAMGLNTKETPTVLVDGALQFGDVAVSLNLQAKNSIVDLSMRSEEMDLEFVDEVLLRHESGLRVLAAPPRPEMADEVHAEQVRNVLQFLKRNYAYVVVDTSSTMDDVTLAILDIADLLIAVATPEIPAIKDARLLFDLLGVLEFPRERILFVINKMDKKSGITTAAIADNLNIPIDGEVPLDERAVSISVNRGIPLLMGDRGSPSTRSILDLLGSIKQRLVEREEELAE
jgi:pilus assembly protein CpaE